MQDCIKIINLMPCLRIVYNIFILQNFHITVYIISDGHCMSSQAVSDSQA